MSYFQDKDKTSLFCIANLSKLTSLIQTAENKKFGNNHVQFIPILNRAIQCIMIHGLLLFRKIRKNIQRTKRTLFYLKMLTLPAVLR